MSTPTQPKLSETWRFRVGSLSLIAACIYVLSFGPAVIFSRPAKYAGYERPARFPSLARAVDLAYSPLFGVLTGNAGSVPRNALQQYVHLWDYGAPAWEKSSKAADRELEADVKRTIEALRKQPVKESN